MNSSGIKRGLAGSAITALAISGLPFLATSASAVPLSNGLAADAVQVIEPGTTISGKQDGTNQTYRLQAIAGSNVSSVTFAYSLNGTNFTTIGTATSDNGSFALEWNPSAVAGAGAVTIRATAGSNTDDSNPAAVSNVAETVNITDGESIGVFQSPYGGSQDFVSLSGTSSELDAEPELNYWNGTAFAGGGTSESTTPTTGDPKTGTWAGVLNIDGYNFGANDQLLVQAVGGVDSSNDTEAFALYKQTITAVSATAKTSDLPANSGSTPVTVTVKDQNGAPIAGARVKNSDGTQTETTNGKGQAEFTQTPGSDFYYADATNTNGYNPELGDKKSDTVAVTQYVATPTTLAAKSSKGAAFDHDEASVITVQVKDQKNTDYDPSDEQDLRYYWKVTKFDGTVTYYPGGTTAPANQAAYDEETTETAGKFEVALPTNDSAKFELFGALESDANGNNAVAASKLLEVTAGQAAVKYDEAGPEQEVAGGAEDVTGKLVLEDGTVLPGRSLDFTYTQGAESGEGANAADANLVQADGTTASTRTVKTGDDGAFSVTVKDKAETPQPVEKGGKLDVKVDAAAITLGGAPAPQGVDFIKSVTPGAITVENQDDSATPGEITEFDIKVTDGIDTDTVTPGVQDSPLTGQTVKVTVDEGFFTDGKYDPKPAAKADAGEYNSLGKEIEVKTDGSGMATVKLVIERNEGFDDDGLVTAKVTATAGDKSASDTQEWDSSDPINGGEVQLVESPESFQDSQVLPDAQVGQQVFFDVFVTDQFGNRVGGEPVDLSENGPFSTIRGEDGLATTEVESDFIFDADFSAEATRPNTQKITASWTTDTAKFTDANGTVDTTGDETLTDSYTINWYAVDFANSTFTITSSPEGDVIVGQPVTETVKVVDENGNPVSGLDVSFIRQGPGDQQDGDANNKTKTNSNGEAFYSFTGTEAGTANISAVISDGQQNKTLTDTVTFVAPGGGGGGEEPMPCEVAPSVLISGDDNGGAKDVVRFVTEDCATGDSLQLFKIRGTKRDGNKRLVEVRQTEVEDGAEMVFKVRDANGKRKTRFVAKVKGEAYGTAKSNTQKIR